MALEGRTDPNLAGRGQSNGTPFIFLNGSTALKGVTIWYLETGFQTAIASEKLSLYHGVENDARPLAPTRTGSDSGMSNGASPGWDQATQLANAIRLASCQPAVGAFFNFHLADESDLAGWQSGILWADGTPKSSYAAVKAAIAEVAAARSKSPGRASSTLERVNK